MNRLIMRAEGLARRAENRASSQLAERLATVLPDAEIERSQQGLVVTGTRLVRRFITEAQLRFLQDELR